MNFCDPLCVSAFKCRLCLRDWYICKLKHSKHFTKTWYSLLLLFHIHKMCLFFKETLCKCYCQDTTSAWQRGAVSDRLWLPRTHALLPRNEGQDSSSTASSTSEQNHINNHPGTFNTWWTYVSSIDKCEKAGKNTAAVLLMMFCVI